MSFVSRLFFSMLFILAICGTERVFARPPSTQAEHALLYWRYLCRGEKQVEIIQNQEREFKCIAQGWSIRTPASNGNVKEIFDESP